MEKLKGICVDFLVRMKDKQIAVFGVLGAAVLSEIIVAAVHYAFWGGRISAELVLIGFITPLLDASLILFFIVALISRLRESARNLHGSNRLLEDVTHGIAESILLVSRDFKVLWGNKTALRQTGLTLEELIGKKCHEVTHRMDEPCPLRNETCPICELIHSGAQNVADHIHFDKDGNKSVVEVCAFPVRDDSGDVVSYVHISRDITNRKKLESERDELIASLRDALARVRTLSGLLPICSACKKIRDDKGYWTQVETYITAHTDADFTHGLCPGCAKKLYPDYYAASLEDKKDGGV